MRNRTKLFFAAAIISACSTQAVADSALSDAFNGLTGNNLTVNDAGYFQSQVRGTAFLGSGRLRFAPPKPVTPLGINVVPPSLDVGCNGIDWHFGALSWVNGENIAQMLQAAGPAALMYVIKLAVNALCEDCANELGEVVNSLQRMANGSMDSCMLGQQIAQAGLGQADEHFCKSGGALKNITDDFSAGRNLCNGESMFQLADFGFVKPLSEKIANVSSTTSDLFGDLFSGSHDPANDGGTLEQRENENFLNVSGNSAWKQLQAAGLVIDMADISAMGNSTLSEDEAFYQLQQSFAIGELLMSTMDFEVTAVSNTRRLLNSA